MAVSKQVLRWTLLVSLGFHLVSSVAYDGACGTATECSGTNAHTFCQMLTDVTPTCTQGTCKCQAWYVWDSGASNCKLRKYYLDKCSSATDACQGGTTCTSGTAGSQCSCPSGETFNYVVGKCVTGSLKGIGEACTTVADCYVEHSGSVSCTASAGASQAVCTCVSPYRSDDGTCRKPYIGEACTTDVGCVREIDVTDTSFATESCISTLCACPTTPTASVKYTLIDYLDSGFVYDICLQSATSQSAVGATCTAANQCTSNLCIQCPESSAKSCVAVPTT